ncbi:MAG: alpha/beta fold hydrolase [Erysipelotrichaceae bacterium]|nr:alpha/beta fold hydrolase [Erysipelotrichaceae bacterium]
MKKLIIVLSILLLVTGCGSKVNIDDKSEEEIVRVVAQAILDHDYKTAYSYMDSSLKDKLSEKRLSDGLEQVLDGLTKSEDGIYEVYEEDDCWYAWVDYEPKDVRFTISMNDQKRIIGLFLNSGRETLHLQENEWYLEQEFLVGEYHLSGILTMPKNIDHPDVVLLIQGSGQSNYNEEIGPNKPFEDIAQGLAKRGIATLRYSKRFYEYPELAGTSYDLEDEYFDDIEDAIEQLKNQPVGNIYYLGHSQGGMFAHYLANEIPEIKGVILMASTPRHLIDLMIDQNKAELKKQGYNEEQCEKLLVQLTKAKESIMNLKEDDHSIILGIPSAYWYELTETLAPNYMNKSIPTLVLQGEEDFQVYADVDYPMWKDLLKGNGEYNLYPSLNHLMMPSIHGDVSDYEIEAHVEEQVVIDIADWIYAH